MALDVVRSRDTGDRHNNGRAVRYVADKGFFKPRPTTWEWLFLSSDSILRHLMDRLDLTVRWPTLRIQRKDSFFEEAFVEPFEVSPLDLSPNTSRELGVESGKLLALAFWFGLSDLNNENVLITATNKGPAIFPIDIECVLSRIDFLDETHLMSAKFLSYDGYGLARLDQFADSDFVGALIVSFINGLASLDRYEQEIFGILSNLGDLRRIYSRVLIKPTSIYRKAIEDKVYDRKLFGVAEIEQMMRPEIPYFFRPVCSNKIYYLNDNTMPEIADIEPTSFKLMVFSKTKLSGRGDVSLRMKFLICQILKRYSRIIRELDELVYDGLRIRKTGRGFYVQFEHSFNFETVF